MMKVTISATSIYYGAPEVLLKEYPCLRDYNFEIKECVVGPSNRRRTVRRAYIEVADLEALFELSRKTCELVITTPPDNDVEFEIEIYDDYRE